MSLITTKPIHTKGFIGASLALVFLIGIAAYILMAQAAEKAALNRKIEQTQLRYYAESIADMQMRLLKNKIANTPKLFVTFITTENPTIGDTRFIPTDSDYIIENASEKLGEISEEAVYIVRQAATDNRELQRITASLSAKDNIYDGLKLHNVAYNNSLEHIMSGSADKATLSEIELESVISFSAGELHTVISVSGITLEKVSEHSAADNPYSVVALAPDTSEMTFKYKNFIWR